MTTHTRNSTRFAFLALLALGPATPWAPAPAEAQQIPWVGLAAPGAQLHGEIGLYPHSPGGADHLGFAVAAGDFDGDSFDDLASGIPGNDCDVVTWDCGSVREVIDDRVTGFIVNDEEEAMEAVHALPTIDRHRVRDVFEHRFTAHVMARSYLTLYRRLLEGHAIACRA